MTEYRRIVLKLYRDLLKYGQNLEFTDYSYFYKRIREEFLKNQNIKDAETIQRLIKVSVDFVYNFSGCLFLLYLFQKGQSCLTRRKIL